MIIAAPLDDPSKISDPSVVFAVPSVSVPFDMLAFVFPLTTFVVPEYHANSPAMPTTTVPDPEIVLHPNVCADVS